MKKYIFYLLILMPGLIQAQSDLIPLNLTAEKSWTDGNVEWRSHGTAFYNYEGTMYAVAYVPVKVQTFPSEYTAYPYFYKCYASTSSTALQPLKFYGKNYIDYFGYLGEDGCEHEAKIMGHPFFFEYNEQLWYFQHVHANYYSKSSKGTCDESYECFAQMPEDSTKKWVTHIKKWDPAIKYDPMGAIQLDSLLIIFTNCNDENSSNYHKWALFTYKYVNGGFTYAGYELISTIPGNKFGGIISREGNNGPMLIFNTYSSDNHAYLGMLLPKQLSNGVMTFTYTAYTGVPVLANVGASTIVSGSVKGGRSLSYKDPYPGFSERMSMISVNSTTTNGNYTLGYLEYLISNDWLEGITFGTMAAPSSYYPHKDDSEFNIEPCYGLVLSDFNDTIVGMDGYQKYNWVFFPNSSGKICGVGLQSDRWLADPNSLVTSTDLADTTTYHQDIKSLWTLLGIVEGAPPGVIDWEVWDHLHTYEVKPSQLLLEKEQTSDTNTSTTCNYGGSFTFGSEMSMEAKHIEMGFGSKTSYSKNIKQAVDLGTEVKRVISQEFQLDDLTQEYGAFIYGVPQITRFSYQVHPWYDTGYIYPVNNSLQFLFMMRGMALRIEKVYFDHWPFNIPDPDSNLLMYWKAAYRPNLAQAVKGLSPINVSWSEGFHGNDDYLRKGSDSTSTYSYDLGYDKEYEASVHIPAVFNYNMSAGKKVEYSTDCTVKTGFGNSIKVSLEPMYHEEEGLDMDYLSVDTYLIRSDNNSTNYLYNELDGQEPWYIAYIVGDCEGGIQLLAPVAGSCAEPDELIFTWTSLKDELSDYTIFINDADYTSPVTTIASQETGSQTIASISGFIPEKGKIYFWQVRGISSRGTIIWSKPSSFMVSCDEAIQEIGLIARVYPNPVHSDMIQIAIDPIAEETISVNLFNMNGGVVASMEVIASDGMPLNITFPELKLPAGIYFAVIRAGEEMVVKKVIVR